MRFAANDVGEPMRRTLEQFDKGTDVGRKHALCGTDRIGVSRRIKTAVYEKFVEFFELFKGHFGVVSQYADLGILFVERYSAGGKIRLQRFSAQKINSLSRMVFFEIFRRRRSRSIHEIPRIPKPYFCELFSVFFGSFGRIVRAIHQLFPLFPKQGERLFHLPDRRLVYINRAVHV